MNATPPPRPPRPQGLRRTTSPAPLVVNQSPPPSHLPPSLSTPPSSRKFKEGPPVVLSRRKSDISGLTRPVGFQTVSSSTVSSPTEIRPSSLPSGNLCTRASPKSLHTRSISKKKLSVLLLTVRNKRTLKVRTPQPLGGSTKGLQNHEQ